MRSLLIGLGITGLLGALAFMTLRPEKQVTPDEPIVIAAEREVEGTLETRVMATVVRIIRTAQSNEPVELTEVQSEIGGMLEAEGVSDEATRNAEIETLVGNIVGRAAEMDGNAGFSALQEQAVNATARMLTRSLLANLGAELEQDEDVEPVPGTWIEAPWTLLSGYEFEDHMTLPEEVTALHGQNVMAFGYLIGLDENLYLLVQNLWSCCFGTAPDIHEAIVVAADDELVEEFEGRGVRIYGPFEAEVEYDEEFPTSLYRMTIEHIRPL